MPILFAYVGADSADAAIGAAGSLLTRQAGGSVVVSVWHPPIAEGLRAVRFGGPSRSPWTPPRVIALGTRGLAGLAVPGQCLDPRSPERAAPRPDRAAEARLATRHRAGQPAGAGLTDDDSPHLCDAHSAIVGEADELPQGPHRNRRADTVAPPGGDALVGPDDRVRPHRASHPDLRERAGGYQGPHERPR